MTKRVHEYLDECAYLRFAQAGQSNGTTEQMLGRAKALLAELQKEIGLR